MSFNYSDAFPDRWLHADDLKGEPQTATIAEAYSEKLRGPSGEEDVCYVIKFRNRKKEYILNKTNAFVLAKLFGMDSAAWIGKSITMESKDDSRSPTGKRIIFSGSPDIDTAQHLTLPGGERRTVKVTKPFAEES